MFIWVSTIAATIVGIVYSFAILCATGMVVVKWLMGRRRYVKREAGLTVRNSSLRNRDGNGDRNSFHRRAASEGGNGGNGGGSIGGRRHQHRMMDVHRYAHAEMVEIPGVNRGVMVQDEVNRDHELPPYTPRAALLV